MDRQRGIVWLYYGIGHFGRGHHAEGVHDAVGILFTDLADEEGAHTGASASTERVGELEALQAITALCLFTNHVQDGVHQFRSLGVVAFRPVVSSTTLTCGNRQIIKFSQLHF